MSRICFGVLGRHFAAVVKGNAQLVEPRERILDFPLKQIGDFLVEDFRCRRIAHVVAFGVILRRIDVGGGDAILLNPQPIDVVFEAQSGRKEGRQAKGVVVTRHAAVHPPVLLGQHGTEVDQDVEVVERVEARLLLVGKEHVDIVQCVDVVGARAERLRHLHDRVVRQPAPLRSISEFSRASPFVALVSRSIAVSMSNSPRS